VPHGREQPPESIRAASPSPADQQSTITVTLTVGTLSYRAASNFRLALCLLPPEYRKTRRSPDAQQSNEFARARERIPRHEQFRLKPLGAQPVLSVGLSAMFYTISLQPAKSHMQRRFSGRHRVGPLLADELEKKWLHKGYRLKHRINAHAANRASNHNDATRLFESIRRHRHGCCWIRATVAALPFTGGGRPWSYTSCNAGFGNAPE